METLGEYIHQANLKLAEELGIPFVTRPKETKSATHKIEIRFVHGQMARKMREFYMKQKPKNHGTTKTGVSE